MALPHMSRPARANGMHAAYKKPNKFSKTHMTEENITRNELSVNGIGL